MANWWDNGLQGKAGTNDLAASGQTQTTGAYLDLKNGSVCGSIVLREDNYYSQLLYTSSSGIQIYGRITYTEQHNVPVYHPNGTATVRNYGMQIELRRAGYSILVGGGYNIGSLIAGTSDLQTYYYRMNENEPTTDYDPSKAYPKNGHGNVQSISVVSTNAGLEFYVVGYGGLWGSYQFTAPATKAGDIPASWLNNPLYFNPDRDRLNKAEADVSGDGSGYSNGKNIDYDYPANDIDFPGLPSNGAMGLGYYKIFNPTSAQLTSAFDILWVSSIGEWWEVLSKIFYKPEQYIVSLMMFPFAPTTSGSAEIKFGMYPTGVSAATVASQWATVDCGSLTVPMKYGSVLDYSPYEQTQIFLPFIGVRSINVDQISGGTIAIKYNVDLLTGSAVCFVKVSNTGCSNSVLYTYDCNMAMQVPITSQDYSQLFSSFMNMGKALTHGSIPGAIGSGMDTAMNAASMACLSGRVEQSGQLSSNNGMLSGFKPYLILEHPVQSLPSGYSTYNGLPSNITSTLSGLSGFTKIESIHLQIPGATEEELRDIETYLHNGVVL